MPKHGSLPKQSAKSDDFLKADVSLVLSSQRADQSRDRPATNYGQAGKLHEPNPGYGCHTLKNPALENSFAFQTVRPLPRLHIP